MAKELRVKRVQSFIQQEIANIVQNDLRDEGIKAMVNIFEVEISKDLRHAKVKVSVISENEEEIESTIKALIRAKSYIRRSLSKSLKTMYTPEIFFEFIDLGESMRIFEILGKINREEKDVENR